MTNLSKPTGRGMLPLNLENKGGEMRRRPRRERKPIKKVNAVAADIKPKDKKTLTDHNKAQRKESYEKSLEGEAVKAVAKAASADRATQEQAVAEAAKEARDTYESETGDPADVSVTVSGENADGEGEKIVVDVKSEKDKAKE